MPALATSGSPPQQASARAPTRFENFDLLRLVAAASVIFSHAFVVVDGSDQFEPLARLLGPGNILGRYGVYVFFIISGYLITASYRRGSLPDFLLKRTLRILPGLAVCTVLICTLAVLCTYRAHVPGSVLRAAATYISKTVLLSDTSRMGLPGVVFSSSFFGHTLNGSTWSLGPEFLCYLAVAALGLMSLLRLPVVTLLLVVGVVLRRWDMLGTFGYVAPFFAAGSALFLWPGRPRWGRRAAAIAVAGLLLGGFLHLAGLAFMIFGAWLLIAFATSRHQIGGATRFGDLSYGLYLYGWPVEQTLLYLLGAHARWWLVFGLALPITALLAAASWRLVEKPALGLAGSRRFRWKVGPGGKEPQSDLPPG